MASTTEYTVTGMTCQHCVDAVTNEVGGIDGVTGVDVDLTAAGSACAASSQWMPPRCAPPSMRPATSWRAEHMSTTTGPAVSAQQVELVIGG